MVEFHKQFLSCSERQGFVKILLKYNQLVVSRLLCWEILMEELLAFQRRNLSKSWIEILYFVVFFCRFYLHYLIDNSSAHRHRCFCGLSMLMLMLCLLACSFQICCCLLIFTTVELRENSLITLNWQNDQHDPFTNMTNYH